MAILKKSATTAAAAKSQQDEEREQFAIDAEAARLREQRRRERRDRRMELEAEEVKSSQSFLDRVFNDPLYKWAGYFVVLLVFVLLAAVAYMVYRYFTQIAPQEANPSAGSFREHVIQGLKDTFALKNVFSMKFIDTMLTPTAMVLVLFLTWKDHSSFLQGRHKDYKAIITGTGLFGTFSGIFIGLYGFDVSDIDGSVPALLGGLKTAFITSIMALGFSLLLSYLQAEPNAGLSSELHLLKSIDDSLLSLDEGQELTEKQQQMLTGIYQFNRDMREQSRLAAESAQKSAEFAQQSAERLETMTRALVELKQILQKQAEKSPELGGAVDALNKKDLFG